MKKTAPVPCPVLDPQYDGKGDVSKRAALKGPMPGEGKK